MEELSASGSSSSVMLLGFSLYEARLPRSLSGQGNVDDDCMCRLQRGLLKEMRWLSLVEVVQCFVRCHHRPRSAKRSELLPATKIVTPQITN